MTISLNSLTNFELNALTIKSYCAGQSIQYEPQRLYCDITELMDDTCYFVTASGSEQNFNFITSESISSFISEYKINIQHHGDDVTVSSEIYPDIPPITLINSSYRKAICFMVIKIADRFRNQYT